MSSHYSPGCKDETYNVCDFCEIDDGRKVIFWKEKDFALCLECVDKLFVDYLLAEKKDQEVLTVVRKSIPERTRNRIFRRDGFRCLKCGSKEDLVIDHIRPFSRGGTTAVNNLQTLCRHCNRKKGNSYD